MMEQSLVLVFIFVIYIGILVVHSFYLTAIERKLFLIRLHAPWGIVLRSLLHGFLGGILTSVLIWILGIYLQFQDLVGVWVLSILLMLIHTRLIHFIYASALLSLFAYITQNDIIHWSDFKLDWLQGYLEQVQIIHLLAFAGLLYLIEAFLIFLQKDKDTIAILLQGQRGRLVGGKLIQSLWFLPFLAFSPSAIGIDLSFMPDWWPFYGTGSDQMGTLTFIPIMIGFSQYRLRSLPKGIRNKASGWMIFAGILVLGTTYLAQQWSWLMLISILFLWFLHEGFILFVQYKEINRKSFYSHSNQGLSVLEILPGSPAAEMGILSGEVIAKVNGQEVNSTKEFYAALQQNAAFCKLEVINLEGNLKFAQRSLYSGDHHLLGIIFAPDEETSNYLRNTHSNLIYLLLQKVKSARKYY